MSDRKRATPAFKVFLVSILAAFSTGWLFPAYLALSFLFSGIEKLKLGDQTLASFPFFPDAQRQLGIAAVWFGAVIFFWSFVAGYRCFITSPSAQDRSRQAT